MNNVFDIFLPEYDKLYYLSISVISGISLLRHDKTLTDEERDALNCSVKCSFNTLDKMNVSFRFQNSLVYVGEKYNTKDYYLRELIIKAIERIKGIENIYRN